MRYVRTILYGGTLIKAAVMGVMATLIDVAFLKSLILIVVSAAVSGGFALLVAYVTIRAQRDLHERLARLETRQEDVAGMVGADKRSTDPTNGDG